jgi:hypothetical protein
MSTKISKGARLHLLQTVERLEFPVCTVGLGWILHGPSAAAVAHRQLLAWASEEIALLLGGPDLVRAMRLDRQSSEWCPIIACAVCAIRDCPHRDPTHYREDMDGGCASCGPIT